MQPPQLIVTGTNFGSPMPTVNLDGLPLTVVTYTTTNIVAQLSANQATGSFLLQLKNASGQLAAFDATIGATGPQGAPGPQGLPGSTGPQGPAGPGTNLQLYQSLYVQDANSIGNFYSNCNVGGTVVGGTCGSAEADPYSVNIVVNGSGLSGDGLNWICKTTNNDLFTSHPIALGSLCSYPINAAGARMAKPATKVHQTPLPAPAKH